VPIAVDIVKSCRSVVSYESQEAVIERENSAESDDGVG
jgi:hypothetical protein